MWGSIPKIITAAAVSQLGIWALIIIALGLIAFLFFRRAPFGYKVGVFVFMFIGFGLFGVATSRVELPPSGSQTQVQSKQEQDRLSKANALLELADRERTLGHNDKAREAYIKARTLYEAAGNRLGQAHVLMGLGELERKLGRNDEAREAYAAARTLYEAAGNRLGQAHVLMGLGELERKLGRNNQAKKNFDQAAYMYEALGVEKSKELAVKSSEALGNQNN